MKRDLDRFVAAQEKSYQTALKEIKNGKKQSHWMWYIFPQIKGLGISPTAVYYAIQDRKEAEEYLVHPLLGQRLQEACEALLALKSCDAMEIFGEPDHRKLRSSMTLFYLASGDEIFQKVLGKFFDGALDPLTISLLQ